MTEQDRGPAPLPTDEPPSLPAPGARPAPITKAVGALIAVAAVAGALLWAGLPGAEQRGMAVPAELLGPAAGPVVLPVTAPRGYSFEASSASASQGVVDNRSVLLRPARLDDQPTVTLCAQRPGLTDRCPSEPTTVVRQVDGLAVTVTLRGPAGDADLAYWSSAPLTTDPRRSSLFAAQDTDQRRPAARPADPAAGGDHRQSVVPDLRHVRFAGPRHGSPELRRSTFQHAP